MKRPEPKNRYEQTVLANVKRFGWHCTSVGSDAQTDDLRFTYTVGLHASYGQPEFIIFGLEAQVAHEILSTVASAAESGTMFALDAPCSELLEGYDCAFVPVPRESYGDFVASALWFHGGDEFPLYQVVWPDRHGLFPWQDGAEVDPLHRQPVPGRDAPAAEQSR